MSFSGRFIASNAGPLAIRKVEINRPDKANAMSSVFFTELRQCFDSLAVDPACRAVVICGSGTVIYITVSCGKHTHINRAVSMQKRNETRRLISNDTTAKLTWCCCRLGGNERRTLLLPCTKKNEPNALMVIFTPRLASEHAGKRWCAAEPLVTVKSSSGRSYLRPVRAR